LSESGIEEILATELVESKTVIQNLQDRIGKLELINNLSNHPFEILSTKPLIISGIALAEGLWKGVNYVGEEISKAVKALVGMKLMVEHGMDPGYRNREVGKVQEARWDKDLKAIIFKAKVTDSDASRDVVKKRFGAVSMSTHMNYSPVAGNIVGKDMNFLELSLVESPACSRCLIFSKEQSLSNKIKEENIMNDQKPQPEKDTPEDKDKKEEVSNESTSQKVTEDVSKREDKKEEEDKDKKEDTKESEAKAATKETEEDSKKDKQLDPEEDKCPKGKYSKYKKKLTITLAEGTVLVQEWKDEDLCDIKALKERLGITQEEKKEEEEEPKTSEEPKTPEEVPKEDKLTEEMEKLLAEELVGYQAFMKKCMKEKKDIKEVTARMKACALEYKKQKPAEEKSEEKEEPKEEEPKKEEAAKLEEDKPKPKEEPKEDPEKKAEEFKCSHCDYVAKDEKDLVAHIKKEHPEKYKEKYGEEKKSEEKEEEKKKPEEKEEALSDEKLSAAELIVKAYSHVPKPKPLKQTDPEKLTGAEALVLFSRKLGKNKRRASDEEEN